MNNGSALSGSDGSFAVGDITPPIFATASGRLFAEEENILAIIHSGLCQEFPNCGLN